jgi:ergothioneine biosynthesis protein EgtB
MKIDNREIAGVETEIGYLRHRFASVRTLTETLVANLSDADASAQSMPDASPAKWHLGHTTWFFEAFILQEKIAGYRPFDERFSFLFNSYYEAKGARIARGSRGLLTRPSLDDVLAYRAHVNRALIECLDILPDSARDLAALGCHHEEQHQELLLTDLQHLFAQNPLCPAIWPPARAEERIQVDSVRWISGREGPVNIGNNGHGFSFDCEGPRHTVWLRPHAMADRLATNEEWRLFMADGGYENASLWLSDGWTWVRQNGVRAPLYWREDELGYSRQFGLAGLQPIDPCSPVRHVSYFEADAFARWAGARLPMEAEWESAAEGVDPEIGVFLDVAEAVAPRAINQGAGLGQLFGDLWEWTGSAYLAHPGFRPAEGAVGEYNGKFMSGQFVLKGGSCATPRGHVRASYRNFFYPQQRWQFTGVRLAKDI